MKKSFAKELQTKLLGYATEAPEVRTHLATDQSPFQIEPTTVVYPANTADVRKTVQQAWERAGAGRPTAITVRGLGAGLSGGALGPDVVLATTAQLNKIIRLDHDTVTVQPGMSFRTLEQTLYTHNRWLPALPASSDYTTVGAAIATDQSGITGLKYGSIRRWVKKLKVVLADGSLVVAERISARELNRRKGYNTFEGEVYRHVDSVLLDNADLIANHMPNLPSNASGYALSKVKGKDGSFDLSQLIIGSGGTLGIVTEATLQTSAYNPRTSLVVGYFESSYQALEAVARLRGLKPSTLEFADRQLMEAVTATHPGYLDGLLPGDASYCALLVQFDQFSQLAQRLATSRAERIIRRHHGKVRTATDPVEQVALWKLRTAAGLYVEAPSGSRRAVPGLDGAIVPVDRVGELLEKTVKLLKKYELTSPAWGHVGSGHLAFWPQLDLSKRKDADKWQHLTRDYADLVAKLGGAAMAATGDGVGTPGLEHTYGHELAAVMAAVKQAMDPHGVFAPYQKTVADAAFAREHMRSSYGNLHHHAHRLNH